MLPSRLPTYENFLVQNGILTFDPTDGSMNINTKFGGGQRKKDEPKLKYQPRTTTIGGIPVIAAYGKDSKGNEDEIHDIMTSLKGKGPYPMNKANYEQFIDRTAQYLRSLLGSRKADLLVTVESSSPLVRDLAQAMLKRMSGCKYLPNGVVKNHEIETIRILTDHPKITAGIQKNLEGALRKALRNGYFEIKGVQPMYRKFLDNWLLASSNLGEQIDGKHVILLDDFLTSGSTMLESIRSIQRFGAATVTAMAILK